MSVELSKRKVLWALSGAIDLVGVTDLSHGKRVAFIADTIREELDFFPWTQNDVIVAGLLHDCGVSSTDMHEHLVHEMEFTHANDHCKRGASLLELQSECAHLSNAILLHHTRWEEMDEGRDELLGNLLFLADRIDVLAATATRDILMDKQNILDRITSFTGILFSPRLVEAFLTVGSKDIFWLNRGEVARGDIMKDWLNGEEPIKTEFSSLVEPLTLFASCVDGKSPFTYNHSVGVASLSKKIAELVGIKGETLYKIEIAGLMHDLGKLKVPDYIIEKDSKLDAHESFIMRHHSYDTFCILSQIDGLEDIGLWSAQHHERLNGLGYPKSEGSDQISLESRILAIADIFQALAQTRPYRAALESSEIIEVLTEMTDNNEIDRDIMALVSENMDLCMKAAVGSL